MQQEQEQQPLLTGCQAEAQPQACFMNFSAVAMPSSLPQIWVNYSAWLERHFLHFLCNSTSLSIFLGLGLSRCSAAQNCLVSCCLCVCMCVLCVVTGSKNKQNRLILILSLSLSLCMCLWHVCMLSFLASTPSFVANLM